MATNEEEHKRVEQQLLALISDRNAQIEELQAKNEDLQRQIAELKKQKGVSGVYEGLTFQDRQGIYTDEKGQGFCPICLDQDKRRPLKPELPWGWRCSADPKHYFSNPDAPDPNKHYGGGGGPNSWMGA